MGIYEQPNEWQCGPFALKHALLALGIFEHEDVLARAARSDTNGTDEVGLGRAARRVGCDLLMVRTYHPRAARLELNAYLARNIPVLACVQEWSHWIALVHHEDGHYVTFDSRGRQVLQVLAWEELSSALVYYDSEGRNHGTYAVYDLHPVVPRSMPWARARFSPALVRDLSRPERSELINRWQQYADALRPMCVPLSPQSELTVPLADVLRRQSAALAARVAARRLDVARRAGVILEDLVTLADAYALEVRPDAEGTAIDRIAALLERWAAEVAPAAVPKPSSVAVLPDRPRSDTPRTDFVSTPISNQPRAAGPERRA